MTKKILDASVGGSSSTTAEFTKELDANTVLRVEGPTDVSVSLNGGKVDKTEASYTGVVGTSESHSNVDTSSGAVLRFFEVDGYEGVQFSVTNNTTSSANITVYAEGFEA